MGERPSRIRVSGDELAEVAHLACLRELGRGATHALNNALTIAFAQTSLGDLDGVRAALDRCVTTSHALARRQAVRFGLGSETDLVRSVSELGGLLEVTLSSRFTVSVELAEEELVVVHDPARIETLCLAVALRAVQLCPGDGQLVLQAELDKPGYGALAVELRSASLPADAAGRWLRPEGARQDGFELALRAVGDVAAQVGASLEARPVEGGMRARVVLLLEA